MTIMRPFGSTFGTKPSHSPAVPHASRAFDRRSHPLKSPEYSHLFGVHTAKRTLGCPTIFAEVRPHLLVRAVVRAFPQKYRS